MDYVNVLVHIFQKHIREYYDIESLWGDAKITTITTNVK
jgi:ribosome-associated protein